MSDRSKTTRILLAAFLAFGLAACSDDTSGTSDTGVDAGADADAGGDMSPDVEADIGADGGDAGDQTPPAIDNATLVENSDNVLSAFIELDTDEDAIAWAVADDGDGHVVTTPATALGTDHEIWLVGLHAELDYDVTVYAQDEAGNESTDDSLSITTAALPDDIPPVELITGDGGGEGVTMLSVFRWVPGVDDEWHMMMAVDQDAEVIWYHRVEAQGEDFRRLDNGNFVYTFGNRAAREINLMGETVNDWVAADLDPPTDTIHHEIFPLPNGNYLALSTELRNIDGYPDPENEGSTIAYDVVGDVMVEFQEDGTAVNSESLLDILEDDELRVRPGFHASFWNNRYAEDAPSGTKDWSHANAVVYDPVTNLVLVSARTHNWVVAYDYTTGDLMWRLGCEGDFELTNGTSVDESCDPEWQYNQHAPEVQADGSLLIYDNGNTRPGTGGESEPPPYSRAVRISYDDSSEDPTEWTATVEWEFVLDVTANYAPIIGDADRLDNDNILVTYGGLVADPSSSWIAPDNRKQARIVEVTDAENPAVVWQIELLDPTPDPVAEEDPQPIGYHVYRSERLPSLYLADEE